MEKAKVIFQLEGVNFTVQCSIKDKMKDICQKFAIKVEKNINSLVFLYGGNQLNFNLNFENMANSLDKERKEMQILVYTNELDNFICPKCGEKIKINTEKIDNIILSINNIKDTLNGAKLIIDNIIKTSSMNSVNMQLKSVNLILNSINDEILKNNEKLKNLLNDNESNLPYWNYNLLDKKTEELKNENIIPIDFKFSKTISNDIFKRNFYNKRACIFIFCDNKAYIAFGENSLNLVGYDIDEQEKFTIFKKLHKEFFDSVRHYYDYENDRDLLITASPFGRHVTVINFKREESEKIIDLNFQSKNNVIINTAYFINDIILIPFSSYTDGTIKFYNMNEEFISELEQNLGFILHLNVYYEEKSKNNYLLITNTIGIFSYNMEKSSIKKFIPKMTPEEEKKNAFN